jgi:hypothetical protein
VNVGRDRSRQGAAHREVDAGPMRPTDLCMSPEHPHEDSAITLGELGRRLDELRSERTWRVAFWAALASGLALTIALAALVVAL